jgi:Flp pilus assembly protein TadD
MITDNLKIWILTAVSAVTLILAIADVAMTSKVRELQADVTQRQQYLNQSVALGRLNTQIIQTLARMSSQSNDEAIRALLAKNGVTFKVTAPADGSKQEKAQ